MTADLATLPALKGLGDLAGLRPVIVTDTREQLPLPFKRLAFVRGTLATGDYSFRGGEELFAVERKSIADLVGCCVGDNRERFFRELHRLRGYRFKRLLVVGTRDEIEASTYRSDLSPKAVLATLSAIEARFDTPVVFAATPTDAGEQVETWAWWMAREMTTTANDLLRGCRVGEPICS